MRQSGRCLPVVQIRGKLILSRPLQMWLLISWYNYLEIRIVKLARSKVTDLWYLTLKFRSKMNIGKHLIISELIKSFQKQRPVSRSLAPKWDLAFVLTYLYKDPFESMNKSSLFHLSIKTSFLLTMAMRVLQKVLSLGSDYFSATFYQTYFYYKPSKYSPFTETHFCNFFTQSRKADK